MEKLKSHKYAKHICLSIFAFAIFFLAIFLTLRFALQAQERTILNNFGLGHAELMLQAQELENTINELNAFAALLYEIGNKQVDYAGDILHALVSDDNEKASEIFSLGQRLYHLEGFFSMTRQAVLLPPNGIRVDIDDLTVLSGASEAQMNILLEGTGLHGAGWYFLEAERMHGVNAIIMAAIMWQESHLGSRGRLAQFNNFAGLTAHPSHPNEPVAIDGAGRWEQWGSRREGVLALGYRLGNFYLHPGQRFYSEAYGPSITGVNQRYAVAADGSPSPTWGPAVTRHAQLFEERIINNYNDSARAARYRNTRTNPYIEVSATGEITVRMLIAQNSL